MPAGWLTPFELVAREERDGYAWETYQRRSYYYLENSRGDAQSDDMRRLEAEGRCLFCPGQEPLAVLHKTPQWTIVPNRFPYRGTRLHLLLVPDEHVTDMADLSPAARDDFWSALAWVRDRYGLTLLRARGPQRGSPLHRGHHPSPAPARGRRRRGEPRGRRRCGSSSAPARRSDVFRPAYARPAARLGRWLRQLRSACTRTAGGFWVSWSSACWSWCSTTRSSMWPSRRSSRIWPPPRTSSSGPSTATRWRSRRCCSLGECSGTGTGASGCSWSACRCSPPRRRCAPSPARPGS